MADLVTTTQKPLRKALCSSAGCSNARQWRLALSCLRSLLSSRCWRPGSCLIRPRSYPSSTALPPSEMFWFGTDEFGRDVFSRTIYAGRLSLMVGAAVVVLSAVIGVTLGLLAGFFQRLDTPIARLIDAMMAFPIFFWPLRWLPHSAHRWRRSLLRYLWSIRPGWRASCAPRHW